MKVTVILSAGLAVAALSCPPAKAQDFFSVLFGRPIQSRPDVTGASPDMLAPPGQVRHRKPRAEVRERNQRAAKDRPYEVDPADAGTLRMFFEDKTLARGDIVVTETGFKVFLGSSKFPYGASDFTSLKSVKAPNLAQLLAMERAIDTSGSTRTRLALKDGAQRSAEVRLDFKPDIANAARKAPARAIR